MKLMDEETEVGLGIGVLRQEKDTNARYRQCRSARDTDTEECGAERAGCRYQERGDANTRREGMLMPRSVILSEQG
jgi:hypothetical protein